MTPRASAGSPTDFVPEERNSQGSRRLKNGCKFSLIDFGGSLQSCLGCRRQLIKPSELAVGLIL